MQAQNVDYMRIPTNPVATGACSVLNFTPMLGTALKQLRKKQGLTQTDLAVKAGLSLSIVQKMEASETELGGTRPTHRAIAQAMGMNLDEFDAALLEAADMVNVPLPRDVFDLLKAASESEKQSAAEWIRKRATPRGLKIKKRLGAAGGASGASRSRQPHAPPN
jgi:transcriptional regulator with XRE-family HTH domain